MDSSSSSSSSKPMHIAMFPWFAMGHLIPWLHLSNKLAKRGHKISLIIPKSTLPKLHSFNLFPHLITFFPITLPHVDGLPINAETASDVPFLSLPLIMTAMDLTQNHIEELLLQLNPHIVFFDLAYWVPNLARKLGIKSVMYGIVNPLTVAYTYSPERILRGIDLNEADFMNPPSGFPSSSIKLRPHEAKIFAWKRKWEFGSGVLFYDRIFNAFRQTDAIAFKGSSEIEGPFVDFLGTQFNKPALLSGPVLPDPPKSDSDPKWTKWLDQFEPDSVIYCALGSECVLEKPQLEELLLGFELSGFPFLAVVKPPSGFESVEEAMPEGFSERTKGKGAVFDGWVQQLAILGHKSVGCFVTHCGAGSLTEGLVNTCQLVLLPRQDCDQIINARMMACDLKVGVEVEKEEDGLFTKEKVCEAARSVMDEESEVGREIRENHGKLRSHLLSKDMEDSYIDSFCEELRNLLG